MGRRFKGNCGLPRRAGLDKIMVSSSAPSSSGRGGDRFHALSLKQAVPCRVTIPPPSNPNGRNTGRRTAPSPRPPAQGTENLRARHVPLPQRGRAPRRPSRGLYGHRHRLPLSADAGLQRHAPDGLGRLRPARRATCQADRGPPADDHGAEHRQLPPAIEDARLLLRLAARAGHDRRRIISAGRSSSSWCCSTPGSTRPPRRAARSPSCPFPRKWPRKADDAVGRLPRPAAAGLSTGSGGQLVSGLGHGAGQRGGPGRPERARRASGGPHAAAAVDAADHRLCRPAGTRPRRAGLAGEHQAPAAQLDRPQHRGGGRFLHRHLPGRGRQAVAAGV